MSRRNAEACRLNSPAGNESHRRETNFTFHRHSCFLGYGTINHHTGRTTTLSSPFLPLVVHYGHVPHAAGASSHRLGSQVTAARPGFLPPVMSSRRERRYHVSIL
ncbi:hypothetical protein BTHE_1937 [Bifidobacterium thermophilum]|nr:hypothetical protein BTHE_1937 [Bifidobacterium thermophilum]